MESLEDRKKRFLNAISSDDVDAVKRILDTEGWPCDVDDQYNIMVRVAERENHLIASNMVQAMLNKMDSAYKSVVDTNTILHLAARWKTPNSDAVIRELVAKDATMGIRDQDWNYPIQIAFLYHQTPEIINLMLQKYLLQRNARNLTNRQGMSLYHIACCVSDLDTVKKLFYMLQDQQDVTQQIDVNEEFEYGGYTSVHFAAQNPCDAVLDFLLEEDANVFLLNREGYSPLFIAWKSERWMSLWKLLNLSNAPADIATRQIWAQLRATENLDGYTHLHLAIRLSRFDIFEFLLKDPMIDCCKASALGLTPHLMVANYPSNIVRALTIHHDCRVLCNIVE